MRPPRADIAAPELPPRMTWVDEKPGSMAELTAAGPVLVHFFDFAQLNSVRALPYAIAWNGRYRDHGLSVIGVHAARFPFTDGRETVATAVGRLGIEHPVAVDSDYSLWRDYGCEGWPSLFLWAPGGALAYFHFGEGEYRATEEAIQELLRSADPLRELPAPIEPLRATDAPGAMVAAPSAEVFPGGSPSQPWTAGGELALDYEAGGAYAAVDGSGELRLRIDDGPERSLPIAGPDLLELANHAGHERHTLRLRSSDEVRVWAISFAAGMPA